MPVLVQFLTVASLLVKSMILYWYSTILDSLSVEVQEAFGSSTKLVVEMSATLTTGVEGGVLSGCAAPIVPRLLFPPFVKTFKVFGWLEGIVQAMLVFEKLVIVQAEPSVNLT